ncbi:preprotein translocase subunit SecG [Neorhodopirellula lusitana]|uniref:Protein-export membrane protein SecG n=1 Tax=Neorhodopirellula lusitana TaxID=445327 RepID=A0ABY1Q0U6_9BACT|nr:preprotein translocase subunit SecG [Neorhodopirellula lusitana]SMP52952.1 preprotein translocase subunit SecG [Neorhodopirellula lusitana]
MASLTNFAPFLPLASFSGLVLGVLMGFLSLFLILLILVQRGRGGGLSGALGGPGGQSAFGSKAGDTFTVITVGVAGVWILVCAFAMWLLGMHNPAVANLNDDSEMSAGPEDGEVEDIASGLVVPTLDDSKDDNVELTPATDGDEAAAETEEPAEAEAVETEAAAEEEAPSEDKTSEAAAE